MAQSYNSSKPSGAQRKQMHYSPNMLSTVNNAIENRLVSYLEYDSREKGVSKREVEPMAIVYKEGKRHLAGFCRLRNEYRSFRLDRINLIRLEKEQFEKRQDFKIEDFGDNSGPDSDDDIDEQY